MISLIFVMSFFAVFALAGFSLFSADNLITILVGFIASTGLTQWAKKQTGLQGVGAMWLSILLSLVVAFVAVIASMFFADGGFSVERLAASGVQIWALAQIAYKSILADK